MDFRDWLLLQENASHPGAKQSLYPTGYGGIGLYATPDYMNWSADAVTYIPTANRYLKFIWGQGMLANPFRDTSLYASEEGKQAPQIEVGALRADGRRFEKTDSYTRTLPLEPKQGPGKPGQPITDVDAD